MKTFFLFISLLFGSTLLLKAQNKATDKQQEVQQTVIDLFQAIADRDFTNLKQNCSSDILILENGAVWNLDTLIAKVSPDRAPDFKRINSFEFIETIIRGKIAWTTYTNKAEVTRNGKSGVIKWLETAILSSEDGQWKIRTLHSTLLFRN